MSDIRREVELLIKANLGSSKQSIDSLNKSISETGAAIDRQVAAAKRGETALDALQGSEAALLQVQSQLVARAKDVAAFDAMTAAFEKAQARVEAATTRLANFNAKLKDGEPLADKQANTLKRYQASLERAEAALAKQQERHSQLNKELADAGVATTNLAESENKLRAAAAEIGVTLNTVRTAIKSYSKDVEEARRREKELADENTFQKKIADAAQLAKSADYVLFWERSLEQADAAEKKLAQDNSLRKAADDAQAATRQYQTLAIASSNLTPRIVSLREAISEIINPSATARATLGGLEEQNKKLTASIEAIRGPVKDYASLMRDIEAVQKSLTAQAGLVDKFQRDVQAVRAARAEFVAYRDEVNRLAAVTRGPQGDANTAKSLVDAQVRAKQAAAALRETLQVARESQSALRNAGIATNDLATAEQRLSAVARQTTGSVSALNQAVEEHGQAVSRGRKGLNLFNDEGRTTLSLTQRLRGEILALAAGYTGIQANINLASKAVEAFVEKQQVMNTLGVAIDSNDPKKLADAWDYLKGRADYLGVGIQGLAKNYAQFSVAARGRGFTDEQTRYAFEQLTTGMRVMGLNTYNAERAWVQLNQALNKGKADMQDLKALADSGFAGVLSLAARGLKTIGTPGIDKGNTEEMFALMKKGALNANAIIFGLATQIDKELGGRVPNAVKSVQAELGRFETAVFVFKNKIAESGFIEPFTKALVQLREFMDTPIGDKLSSSVGSKLGIVAEVVVALVKNFDTLLNVAAAVIALWSGAKIVAAIERMREFAAAAKAASAVDINLSSVEKSATAGSRALGLLSAGLKVATAAFVGWEIGTILYEKFQIVREAAAWLVTGLDMAWVTIKHSFMAAFEVLPAFGKNIFNEFLDLLASMAKKAAGIFGDLARGLGFEKLASSIDSAVSKFGGTRTTESVDAIIAKRRAALAADLAQIRTLRNQMLADEDKPPVQPKPKSNVDATAAGVTGKPGNTPDLNPPAKDNEKKRESLIESITSSLEQMDARVDRAAKHLLSSQIAAVDDSVGHLKRKIEELAKLDPTKAAEFSKRLLQLTADTKEAITKKFNDDMLKEQESAQKKVEEAEVAAGHKEKLNLEVRLKAVDETYAQHYRDLEKLRKEFADNGRSVGEVDAMKKRMDAAIAEIKVLETKKYNNDLIKQQESQINDVLKERDAKLKAIDDRVAAGETGQFTGSQEKQAVIDEMQTKIEQMVKLAREFIATLNGPIDNAEVDKFKAHLDEVTLSGKKMNMEFKLTATQVNSMLSEGLSRTLDTLIGSLTQAAMHTKSWGQAFRDAGRSFLQFAADFLRQIAMMIIKALILKALESTPWGAAIGAVASAATHHSGGVVGSNQHMRAVPAAVFAGAPRYHSGGVAGLMPNEQAAILKKNEEVLTENDPRNILNAGKNGGASTGVRFVLVDDRAKVPEAMASSEGERVVLEHIRRNGATVKQMIGS